MRRLKILEYAISSLWRRKYKNLSILVVYAFTISVLASILLLTHSLRMEANQILQDAPDVVVQRLIAGRHELIDTAWIEPLRQIAGVGKVEPRYWGYYYDGMSGANYTILGLGNEPPSNLDLLEGSLPSGPRTCAIGRGVADAWRAEIGGEVVLVDSRNVGIAFDVVGVFRSQSDILTNDLVVLRDADVVEFFGFPEDRATDLAIQVHNKREVATVAAKVQRIYPAARPITRHEILRTYDAVFSWRGGMMLTVFFSALVAFCILAWDKATGISAEEKREVGILKAIGWGTSEVLELKFWEGLVLSTISFVLGLIAALAHVFWFGASWLAPVIQGWSVVFPKFRLVPYLDLYQVFVMGFLTVVPYVASTVIPSWKTAITDPEEVMRT